MPVHERFPPIMISDNPLMVGVKVPNPADNYAMTESAVLVMLRELQRQKERTERKRLLYVALIRARDHLFMSGTAPEDGVLSGGSCSGDRVSTKQRTNFLQRAAGSHFDKPISLPGIRHIPGLMIG